METQALQGAVRLSLSNFALVYLLLLVVLALMKRSQVNQTKLLVIASVRLTVQLVLAGLVLTYIFHNVHWYYSLAYLVAMLAFAIHRVLSKNPHLNLRFKLVVSGSLIISGVAIILYFVGLVVGQNVFNPQYVIPLGGMIIGNAMTGLNLALKTFSESLQSQRPRIDALINLGVEPRRILLPIANSALETALLPTLNSMLGMGIVALPGMMTGQILSGTLPTTAIMYQIAIMIAIATVVCSAVFFALHFGSQTLYNARNQMDY